MHLGSNDANKGDLLVDVQALSNLISSKAPHIIAAQILVLKHELHIIRGELLLLDLSLRHMLARAHSYDRQ